MRISDWSSDVCSSDLCRFGSQGLDGLCVVLGGQPVGCPLFNSLPDLAIVKCTDAMAHILKEVPLIAAALTEPRICDGMRPRRHSDRLGGSGQRSEEHTSELQSLMRITYAVFRLKKKKQQ